MLQYYVNWLFANMPGLSFFTKMPFWLDSFYQDAPWVRDLDGSDWPWNGVRVCLPFEMDFYRFYLDASLIEVLTRKFFMIKLWRRISQHELNQLSIWDRLSLTILNNKYFQRTYRIVLLNNLLQSILHDPGHSI